MTPEQRRRRARIAAHASWAKTSDRTARTSSGTKAFLDRIGRQIDPEGVLPEETRAAMAAHARKAYTLQLACQSAGLEAAVTADPSPWHGVTSAVMFEDGGRMDLPPEGCLMANSASAMGAQDAEVRARACRLYSETLALFARRITEAQQSGEIDDDIDPEATARALIAVMQGIEFLHKSGIGKEELQRVKTAALEMIERSVGR